MDRRLGTAGAICHPEGSQTLNDAKTPERAVKGFTNNKLRVLVTP